MGKTFDKQAGRLYSLPKYFVCYDINTVMGKISTKREEVEEGDEPQHLLM